MKAVPGILPTLLEMICFFSTPTIDVEPKLKKPAAAGSHGTAILLTKTYKPDNVRRWITPHTDH